MSLQLSMPLTREDVQDADFLPTKISIKLMFSGGEAKRYQSSNSKRILRKLKAKNYQNGVLKMVYGKRMTVQGKIEEFDNETAPLPKAELIDAYYAFLGN